MRIVRPPQSRAELIERLRGQVRALADRLPLRRALLFGSWARGRATAASDIDILLVYDDPPREDAYEQTLATLKTRGVEPLLLTVSQALTREDRLRLMTVDAVDLLVSAPDGS